MRIQQKNKAILAMLMAALSFSLMGVFVKLTGDIPVVQKTLFRSVVTLVIAYSMFNGQSIKLREMKHFTLLGIRCVAGTMGILLNYYAVDYLILSDANVIMRLSTIFVILLSWVFLKERITKRQGFSIGIAFMGMLLIVKPSFSSEIVPYTVAILGAISAAIAYTTLRALGNKEKPAAIVFVFSLFSTIVLLPFVLFNFVPMTTSQWVYALLAGLFAGGGQMGITYAYRLAPAKEVSIYDYYGVIFSALLGLVIFGTLPDILSIIGYCVIFVASYVLYKSKV